MITIQKYVRATSLQEAYELNQNKRNMIIGGMLWIRMGKGNFNTAIDLSGLGLNTIEEDEECFRIGAMATLRQLELHQSFNSYTDGTAAKAVQDIVGVQFRNLATVGGSIFGRFGFSDVLTVFQAYDSYVELYQGGIIPLEDFVMLKPDNDILVRLIVKKRPGKFAYQAMRNARTDFPVLTCAVSRVAGEYKAVIGARPGKAMVLRDAENILKDGINEASASIFASYVAKRIPTGSNVRGSAAYRTHLAEVLTSRALLTLQEKA